MMRAAQETSGGLEWDEVEERYREKVGATPTPPKGFVKISDPTESLTSDPVLAAAQVLTTPPCVHACLVLLLLSFNSHLLFCTILAINRLP